MLLLASRLAHSTQTIDLLEQIRQAWQAQEDCSATLRVRGRIQFECYAGYRFQRAADKASFEYRTRNGRMLILLDGVDTWNILKDPPPKPRRRAYLFLPNGELAMFDFDTEQQRRWRARGATFDRSANIAYSPHEAAWAFVRKFRSTFFTGKRATLLAVTGDAPCRVVTIEFKKPKGVAKYQFRCKEEWGWLADKCSQFFRVGTGKAWKETRTLKVTDVHRTRLCFFPRTASVRSIHRTNTGSGWGCYDSFHYEFDPPEFANVEIPAEKELSSVKPAFSQKGHVTPGQLVPRTRREAPHLQQDRDRSRGALLDAVLTCSAIATARHPRGRLDLWIRLRWFLIAIILLAAGVLIHRHRRILVAVWLMSFAVLGCVTLAYSLRFGFRSSDKLRAALASVPVFPQRAIPPAQSLCGVDVLYCFIRLNCNEITVSYEQILRMAQPSSRGVSLTALRDVLGTVGCQGSIRNPRLFLTPPTPAIVHLEYGHYLLIAGMGHDGTEAVVFDPPRGVYVVSWKAIRSAVSTAALVST